MQPYRSILFVPGHRPQWVAKAVAAGADCVVLDLEDSVPAGEKAAARSTVAESIARVRETNSEIGLFVRVNPLATKLTGADLEATVVAGLTGVFTPKIEQAMDVLQYDALLDHFEHRNNVDGLEYIVPVETVRGIHNCLEVATASPRVGAMIGPSAEHADIAREVGYEWTPEGLETLYLRSRVLLACRDAKIHALTALWEDLENLHGLREFATRGRQLGFRGMIAIHPSHVAVVNDVFTPSDQDIAFYEGLAAAYEQATSEGTGALRYRGLHIDKAHYDKALQWLERAEAIKQREDKK